MHSIIFHTHQKLDRVARRHYQRLAPNAFFPSIRQILHFEAGQGPDGAKLKRATGEQPWHFVNPGDHTDTQIDQEIAHHYEGLVEALKNRDEIRASFEAAWLAHALVDGLTPAHHYPYEQELAELRRGENRHTRKGLAGRLYVRGDTGGLSIKRSYQLIGPKGLLTNHAMFEAGAYSIIAPLTLNQACPNDDEVKLVQKEGVVSVFRRLVREVAALQIYERFCVKGWTPTITRDVRRQLAPRMVMMITLAWYAASLEAGTT